jgi:Reverse transcriptase (RNA-dependent DNA polymerase).
LAILIIECLRRGSIPDGWRGSIVKMLYKGKGKLDNPNAYRGIALECTLFKIMTKILTERLTDLTDNHIPEQQFGFRRGRSTLQAVRCLQQDIEEALRLPRRKLHVIFIEFFSKVLTPSTENY